MNFVKQFLIILIVSFVGEVLNKFIPLPIPASIYGLILMFICLQFKIIKLNQVDKAGRFLIEIMPVMFVPTSVGLMASWGILKPVFVPFMAITIISSIAIFAISGRVTQAILHRKKISLDKDVH